MYTDYTDLGDWLNASTMFKPDGSGGFNLEGLCQNFRLFAGGIKVLPQVETVTSTDGNYVTNFWGGTCTPMDVTNIMDTVVPEEKSMDDLVVDMGISDEQYKYRKGMAHIMRKEHNSLGVAAAGDAVQEVVRNWSNVQEFPNCEGVTVRYDPFQYEEQLETNTLSSYFIGTASNRYNTSNIQFPFVLVKFNEAVNNDEPYPIRIFANVWLECSLVQPTPIFSSKSPVDANFPLIRSIVSDTDRFPLVTKGHSFKNFLQMATQFTSDLGMFTRELKPVVRETKRLVRPFVRPIAQQFRRRRARNKRKRKRRRKNKESRLAGSALPGSRAAFRNTTGFNRAGPNL
jgi:hypothetical protein